MQLFRQADPVFELIDPNDPDSDYMDPESQDVEPIGSLPADVAVAWLSEGGAAAGDRFSFDGYDYFWLPSQS